MYTDKKNIYNRSPIRKRKREGEKDEDEDVINKRYKIEDNDNNFLAIIFIVGLVIFGYYYF
tara:strand:+ start:232 stop:414 length:183 start_codon:yes stop_codon:yes gene_type:complete